ncbi:N-acetyltransferase [Aeromonas dhakensis]|uniref:N-acetyltransferase n=1 Tax=Aeromonas dhakensis TaxID=196024 RepID=UPI0028DE1742|nr:N-acetyltransferase [Aeromonas dhakensis]HEA3084409.1 N-acetyltransferase [Aeromonas dhakensis]
MQIRPFTPADTEAVLAIWLEASLQAHHFIEPAYWHANLAPMREIYLPAADSQVLCLGDQLLGFYSLHEGSLAALFVAPAQQGKGLGKALLEHAKGQLPALRLQVYQQNRTACDFYRAQGFQVAADAVDPHTGCAEWVMVWSAQD